MGATRPCNCTPPVDDPRYRANIGTGGICIYSLGHTVEEALSNVHKHARKDRIPRKAWVEVWVEKLDGTLVAMLERSEWPR